VSLSEWEARVLGMVEKEAGERGIDVRELIARFEHITAAEERGDRSAMQRRDAAGEGQGTGRGGRPRGAHRPHCAVGGWPCLDCFKTANQSPPVL